MHAPWKKSYSKPRQHIKKQRHYFAGKSLSSWSYGFSSSHVWMWEQNQKESWAPNNWCFWTMVLENTLECLLDCWSIQKIRSVNLKVNKSWIFTGRTDGEVEAPIHWPPDLKNCFIGKELEAGRNWRQEKRMPEEEIVGWHHWLNGHEFEQSLGVGKGQGNLACLQSISSQRVEHNWETELNWIGGVKLSTLI